MICIFLFRIVETEAQIQQRLQKWQNFLESGEAAGESGKDRKSNGNKGVGKTVNTMISKYDSASSGETAISKTVNEVSSNIGNNDSTGNTNEDGGSKGDINV